MEFFIDDIETEKLFEEILKKMQLLRNGETHHEMRKFGLIYEKSLGATIINLRELAKQYPKNHLLAHKLWTKGFRESKILATLLEEPNRVTQKQQDRWLSEIDSNELLEQISMNLFFYLPEIQIMIPEWMKSSDMKKQICATLVMGRLAMLCKDEDDQIFIDYLDNLPVLVEGNYYLNQIKRTIGKIFRRNKTLALRTISFLNELKEDNLNWMEICEDLKSELDL